MNLKLLLALDNHDASSSLTAVLFMSHEYVPEFHLWSQDDPKILHHLQTGHKFNALLSLLLAFDWH